MSRIRTRLKGGAAVAAGAAAIAAVAVAPALSVAPGPTPGQAAALTEVANTTPVSIPDGVGPNAAGPVVSSSVTVAGAGASLLDVDLETSLNHSASQDLIVRLRSPKGTTTTITNNFPKSEVSGYSDTFLGTRWDDSASAPVGSKDFGPPPGLPASDLIPVGAMGAFVGENPNGVWTLTMQDRDIGGTGVLNGWDLKLTSTPKPPSTTRAVLSSPTAGASVIPDGGAAVVSGIGVAGAGAYTYDVDVRTFISHGETKDIRVSLKAPSGTIVPLSVRRGGGNWFQGTIWNDSAGTALDEQPEGTDGAKPNLVPDGALGAVIGQNPNGVWQLIVQDEVNDGPEFITCPGDPNCLPTQMGTVPNPNYVGPGTFARWELRLTVAGPPGKPPPAPVKPLTLKMGAKTVKRGKRATFVYRIKNTTKKAIKNVVVVNTLPKGLRIDGTSRVANLRIKKSLRYTGSGRKVTFRLGTIPKGKTRVLKVNAKVKANAAKGRKTNTVTFRGTGVRVAKATARVTIK